MGRRKSSFEEHQRIKQEERLERLRTALKILGGAKYRTVTKLAEAAARLLTEMEAKHAKDGETPEKVHYTSLLRNKEYYRPALDAYFHGEDGDGSNSKGSVSKEDFEALSIHCANVTHQNEMLKDRLASIDLSPQTKKLSDSVTDNESEDRLDDIAFLLTVIGKIMQEVSQLFDSVEERDVNDEHPHAGLWGPSGLVLSLDDVKKMSSLEKECKEHDLSV